MNFRKVSARVEGKLSGTLIGLLSERLGKLHHPAEIFLPSITPMKMIKVAVTWTLT